MRSASVNERIRGDLYVFFIVIQSLVVNVVALSGAVCVPANTMEPFMNKVCSLLALRSLRSLRLIVFTSAGVNHGYGSSNRKERRERKKCLLQPNSPHPRRGRFLCNKVIRERLLSPKIRVYLCSFVVPVGGTSENQEARFEPAYAGGMDTYNVVCETWASARRSSIPPT